MSIYGSDEKIVGLSETTAQVVTGLLVIGVFVAMAFEMPPDVVFLICLVIVMLLEILTLPQVLRGFANESLITIGSLFLVIGAVQKSHVVDYLARKAFGIKSSNKAGTLRMLMSMASLSAVFNNIPLCNLMIPIVRDWARSRGIPLSHLLMPLSYTLIAGGLSTMIGTSTSLIVQGLMQEDIGYSFPFFTPGVIAAPASALLITYMIFCAPIILPSRNGLIREVRDKAESFIAEVKVLEVSAFIGNDVGTMMGRLGLQQDGVIKIRRLIPAGELNGSQHSRWTPADAGSCVDVSDVGLELQLSAGRNRGRAESETLSGKEYFCDGSISEHEDMSPQRSMIADFAYVQQSRGAWGVAASRAAVDDIEVNGYRAVRLSARDIDGTSVADIEHPALLTSPGALESNENGVGIQVKREGSSRTEFGAVFGSNQYRDIINPSEFDTIKSGDVIFIASAADVVTKVLKAVGSERAGLKLLDSSVLDLPGFGSELIELTLSGQNPFIGMSMGSCGKEFSSRYKVGIISTRSRRQAPETPGDTRVPDDLYSVANDAEGIENNEGGDGAVGVGFLINDTRSVVLAAGDTVLCLAKSSDVEELKSSRDFFVASTVGSVPPVMSLYGMVPVAVFMVMISVVAAEKIRMCPAALVVVCLFFLGGWLKPTDIPKLVDMRLLMLMGCSVSFAGAMETSGLAATIAQTVIRLLDPSPEGAIYVIYLLTLTVTETMSNNAAAALMYPLASAIAKQLSVSVLPFALTVLVAATAAFMSPIGYQTHLMVWAPGGYKFIDFVKFGLAGDIIFFLVTCAISPVLFPL